MGKRMRMQDEHDEQDSQEGSAFDGVRRFLHGGEDAAVLTPERTATLTSQLTALVARAERVRTQAPWAGVDLSPNVKELLVRFEAGSGLSTGLH